MSPTNYEERFLALLGEVVAQLAQIAHNTTPEAPEAPDMQRPLELFNGFDWASIDATVVRADEFGANLVEWNGRLWTRRAPENKFGAAIWYSRANGKDADGNNKYLRLITFKHVSEAEPISRTAEKALSGARLTPQPRPTPAPTVQPPASQPAPAPATTPQPSAPRAADPAEFDLLPSASAALRAAGETVRQKLAGYAASQNGNGNQEATPEDNKRAWGNLTTLCGKSDEKRHAVVKYLFAREHFNELTRGECLALAQWISVRKQGEDWLPAPAAVEDLKAVLAAANLGEAK